MLEMQSRGKIKRENQGGISEGGHVGGRNEGRRCV